MYTINTASSTSSEIWKFVNFESAILIKFYFHDVFMARYYVTSRHMFNINNWIKIYQSRLEICLQHVYSMSTACLQHRNIVNQLLNSCRAYGVQSQSDCCRLAKELLNSCPCSGVWPYDFRPFFFTDLSYCTVLFSWFSSRMAPEVIACDENPDATYDNRVGLLLPTLVQHSTLNQILVICFAVCVSNKVHKREENFHFHTIFPKLNRNYYNKILNCIILPVY